MNPEPHEVQTETIRYLLAVNAEKGEEIRRLTAELAAAQAERVPVEWRQMLDGRTAQVTTWAADRGYASLRVAEKNWRTRSFPGWKGEKPGWAVVFGRTYVAASGPETGPEGKAACFAAYLKAAGLA